MIKFESVYLNQNNKVIFSNLNFSVGENQKILIQGKSGIGKTTLFKMILGFEEPDRGTITFKGLAMTRENIRAIRQQIFYLSQDIDLKNDYVDSLLDEILHGSPSEKSPGQDFDDLKHFLDLDDAVFKQRVKELSGGERQRIGLLICFSLDRPVWLLDEPTSAIDDKMKKKVADYITGQDKTIIIISHDSVWQNNESIKIKRWE